MESILKDFYLENCSAILEKKLNNSNFEVKDYKMCPIGEVKGFLGDYCYLLIDYCYEDKDQRERFFVKIKSSSGCRNDFLNENGLFLKECHFYNKLIRDISASGIPIINDCVPQCYFVSDNQYLIFEELERRNYANHTGIFSTLDYIKSGLDALAKLHASGLIFEEKLKTKFGENFRLVENYADVLRESFFLHTKISDQYLKASKQGAETQIDLTFKNSSYNTELLKKIACDIYARFPEIVEPSNVYRNTICHGDLWSSNIMYKVENHKPVHCYIIDFQTVRYGPPAQDFMGFLYLAVDTKIRQNYTNDLMEYYYNKMSWILEAYGLCPEKILSYAEFVESCNHYKIFGCALAMSHQQLIMLPPDVKSKLLKEGIIQDFIFEDRSELIREYWNTNDFYKRKLNENITEFRDILIDNGQL